MRSESVQPATLTPTQRIIIASVTVGACSFGAMFVLALLRSENLGPLFAFFVAGPVGAAVGAVLGALRSATNPRNLPMRPILVWLLVIWVTTLAYTMYLARLASQALYIGLGLESLILAACVFILIAPKIRGRLPVAALRFGPIAIAAIALVLLTTAFPPVMRPWWGTSPDPAAAAPLPAVALIFDQRFDSSRHVPVFTVDRRTLAIEWLAVGVAAVAAGYLRTRGTGGTFAGTPQRV
jgi:hypothetical protein